jgi:hypothetical protein
MPLILNEDAAPPVGLTLSRAPVRVGHYYRQGADAEVSYWTPASSPHEVIIEALDIGGARLPQHCLSDYLQADLSRQVKIHRAQDVAARRAAQQSALESAFDGAVAGELMHAVTRLVRGVRA